MDLSSRWATAGGVDNLSDRFGVLRNARLVPRPGDKCRDIARRTEGLKSEPSGEDCEVLSTVATSRIPANLPLEGTVRDFRGGTACTRREFEVTTWHLKFVGRPPLPPVRVH